MNIKTILADFAALLRSDGYFEPIKIIDAYPFTVKPTQLGTPVIAIGICGIDLAAGHIGDSTREGEASIFADIYVPLKDGGKKANEIFTHICAKMGRYNVLSIRAQRIVTDKDTAACVLKTEFRFNGEIEFGGESGE